MKIFSIGLLLLILKMPIAFCQTPQNTESIKRLLMQNPNDTSRVLLLAQLAGNYRFFNLDSSIIIAQQAIDLAQIIHFDKGKVSALINYGEARRFQGEFPQSLAAQFNALQISKNIDDKEGEAGSLGSIGLVYLELNENRQAFTYLHQAREISKHLSNNLTEGLWLSGIGYGYLKMNMLDSALIFEQQAEALSKALPETGPLKSLILTRLGIIHRKLGHQDLALRYFQAAIKNSYITGDLLNRGRIQYQIAELYDSVKQQDSSLHYCQLAFENGERISQKKTVLEASSLMAKLYKAQNNLDSAFHYQEVAMAANDALYGREKFQQLQLLISIEQQRQQQLRENQIQFQRIGLLCALAVFLLIALLLWRNIRQQQRTNKTLKFKNDEIETQRNILEKTLSELKSTQSQLIQSEKMASLGELTAGIAHEIQNPLNFVNNFSEVNTELLAEMKEEMNKGNIDDAKVIANDVIDNEQKINLHGKRADAIVKGMLLHSQKSIGQKELTDINKLTDEYLRLSYHGFRAKDKSFNADFKTNFDDGIGKINIVPQDIGKVLLNLFNNAFYAVSEKQKAEGLKHKAYEPVVSVITKKINDKVEIKVEDNGNGVPQKALDKIFQPFFTTKPTGQGTGLGLSLAYDIVKAHGGDIKVESKEGEGSEFIINLPV